MCMCSVHHALVLTSRSDVFLKQFILFSLQRHYLSLWNFQGHRCGHKNPNLAQLTAWSTSVKPTLVFYLPICFSWPRTRQWNWTGGSRSCSTCVKKLSTENHWDNFLFIIIVNYINPHFILTPQFKILDMYTSRNKQISPWKVSAQNS